MAKADLTAAESAALAAVDGTGTQPHIDPQIKARLLDLYLIERRSWPDGPLWRTGKGDWRVKAHRRGDGLR